MEMTKRVVGDINRSAGLERKTTAWASATRSVKDNPQGGQVVKLRAPERLCDAQDRAG